MNKFLISLILFVAGIGIGAGIIAATPTAPVAVFTSVAQQVDSQAGWPYCNEPPATIPFFDPCPRGSHVDPVCAAKCGADYQAEIAKINKAACDDFYLLYLGVLIAINEAQAAEISCITSGMPPDVCHQVYKETLLKVDSQHGLAKEKLAKRVAEETQKALDAYFSCLLACPCLENV